MKYREFLDLTDKEIIFIIKDIFPNTSRVDNIEKDRNCNMIYCDIYIMEEHPDYADTLYLSLQGMGTHEFMITHEEELKWKQFLLAKGCDYRLKDNPYLDGIIAS